MQIPIDQILPNPDQPRTIFDQAELDGLAQSIQENGLIQPIVVEEAGDKYILVDGERRWRACQALKLKKIDAILRPSSNHRGAERLTLALVANIQRSTMGPVDEAKAYLRLVDELGSVDAVAKKAGVSTATVSGRLYLLDLDPNVQKLFNLKKLPFDLSVIATFKRLDQADQQKLASTATTRGWKSTTILRVGGLMFSKSSGKKYVPGKREPKELLVSGHFDALAMTNHKALPLAIKVAVRKTCQACVLYKEASLMICKQCPLPDFLNRLEVTK